MFSIAPLVLSFCSYISIHHRDSQFLTGVPAHACEIMACERDMTALSSENGVFLPYSSFPILHPSLSPSGVLSVSHHLSITTSSISNKAKRCLSFNASWCKPSNSAAVTSMLHIHTLKATTATKSINHVIFMLITEPLLPLPPSTRDQPAHLPHCPLWKALIVS